MYKEDLALNNLQWLIWYNSHNLTSVIYLRTVWPIDKTLSGATTPGQSRPGNNGNGGVLHILQISKAGASTSDGLMSYIGHSFGGKSYFSANMQLVHSTAPADWASELRINMRYHQKCWVGEGKDPTQGLPHEISCQPPQDKPCFHCFHPL